jgi:O-antigen/teichoic acid export membrane protein
MNRIGFREFIVLHMPTVVSQSIPLVQRLLQKAGVDRAVLFAILARIWGVAAGPVTALLIATKFTPASQGYYYTFVSLLGLQIFAELGLGTVIIQFASHEWSKLGLDERGRIVGDTSSLSRLVSLAQVASKWYLVASIMVTLGLGIGGYIFFSQSLNTTVVWKMPWFTLCLLTGITLSLVPIWSLLEGCNQVSKVYFYRFFQGLCTSVSIWFAILLGANLWTASISSLVGLLYAGTFIRRNYWEFLKNLLSTHPTGPRLHWRLEILPMQWRIALSWISGYFAFSLFTPVLFQYQGPEVAGQMGMTWSLVVAIGAISSSFLFPKVPRFGILIAQQKYKELDRIFWRITKIIAGITSLLAITIWFLVYILYKLDHPFATRILPPLPTGLFLLAQVIQTISFPISSYLRAHKKEPLLFLSVIFACLSALSALILGRYFSSIGIAAGYLLANIIIFPFMVLFWYRCKTKWHHMPREA